MIATIDALVPAFSYRWLMREINYNLPRELDFTREAQNADECRAMLATAGGDLARRVHVPEVYPDLSSSRVLSMEFIDGV